MNNWKEDLILALMSLILLKQSDGTVAIVLWSASGIVWMINAIISLVKSRSIK